MSDLVNIGSAAVSAYQRALATVSNNIANIGTDGYSRQEVSLESGAPEHRGRLFFGTGVAIAGIKRAYDEFAVDSLRKSYSSLNTQGPLLDYTNRVIDVLGSEQSGLQPAMDSFFNLARQLSATPASSDYRDKFLHSADGVAARFRTLAGELDKTEAETRTAIGYDIQRLNTLSRDLALVNAQLMRQTELEMQPAVLLDQRDRLLVEMAKIAGIRVETARNGQVSVGLGSNTRQTMLVSGKHARELGATFNDSDPGKVDILVDPYAEATAVSSLAGGSLSGLLSFRQQVLQPSQSRLDTLALAFADGVNRLQGGGIDSNGTVGRPLFAIDPVLRFEAPASRSNVWVQSTVVDPAATAVHDIELRWLEGTRIWSATDRVTGQQVLGAPDAAQLIINGTLLTISGQPQAAETIMMRAAQRPATSIRLAQSDPQRVAAGALFRAIPAASNVASGVPRVTFEPPAWPARGPHALDRVLVNNPHPSAAVSFGNTASSPLSALAAVPAGFGSINLQLSNAPGADIDLQIITRDGRHVLGKPLADNTRRELLTRANGFAEGATYSDQYLNAQGDNAYRGLETFYGARAVPRRDPVFDAENRIVDTRIVRAHLDGTPVPATTVPAGQAYIAAGALTLNGRPLDALLVPPGGNLQAGDIANWLNAQVPPGIDIRADATNQIAVPDTAAQLNDPAAGIRINGHDFVPGAAGFASVDDIATAVNQYQFAQPGFGVVARVTPEGTLVLANAPGRDGEDINIAAPLGMSNVLGLPAKVYRGSVTFSSDQALEIGVGDTGHAADLARLGLRAGAFIDGVIPEDLLVFASGSGDGALAAGYTTGTPDRLGFQRDHPLDIIFDSTSHYRIVDVASGALVAQRSMDQGTDTIFYGDLQVRFPSPPAPGDRFRIDGNKDGIGNNENILRIAALETDDTLFPETQTLSQHYGGMIGALGNVSSQAQIARDALKVVNEQAIQSREQAAGVNLDKEAADLIRFQQAYQAAARSIQVGTQLFDAIAQIR